MASSILIPVTEYLATTYRPDCDYIDGELQERIAGELDHSTLQGTIYTLLRNMRHVWHIRAYTELRVQINSSRFRVPDVTVLSASAPKEQIVRHPPLLCIEILSPEDTILRMKDRI